MVQAAHSSGSVSPCVEILTSANGPAVSGGTACGFPAARVEVELAAGAYFVQVSSQFNATGGYNLFYQRLRVQDAVALAPDVPVTETIEPLGDLDLYTFALDTAERVVLQATSSSGNLFPCVEVRTAENGAVVPDGTKCGNPAGRVDLEFAAGTYLVLVSHQFNNATGSYTLLYQRLRVQDAVPLVPDVAATEAIDPIGDLDLYAFTLEATTRVVVQAAHSGNFLLCIEILTGVNEPAVSGEKACGNPAARVEVELAPGTYFVLVSVSAFFNTTIRSYSLVLQRLQVQDAAALTPDVPVTEAIDPVADMDLYTFTLDTAKRVVLQATRSSGGLFPCVEVRTAGNGQLVSGGQNCGSSAGRVALELAAGTYLVLVSSQINTAGGYSLLLQLP